MFPLSKTCWAGLRLLRLESTCLNEPLPHDRQKAVAFRHITVPSLRPTLLLVLTLGLISTWQVFDQIYLTGNNPATRTPAYMSFDQSFQNNRFGIGSAIAFLLFALIFVMTTFQRFVLRDKDEAARRRAERAQKRAARKGVTA